MFEVTKQNTPEIISLFSEFIAWSALDQPRMQIEEIKFNNRNNLKRHVETSASAANQVRNFTRPPKSPGYT
ncbi:hypothetical protein, partial [Enterobacter cloacae]|uniref:hypothetical protein n=1 Tax=Enterobacter cloacae TaxID=550 RepID=UPI0021D26081